MKPYFEEPGVEIYHGDCREILPLLNLSDKSWAVVTDPPYGIGFVHGAERIPYASKFSNIPVIGDDAPFDPTHLLRFDAVLVWGANHYADRLPVRDGRWLVWDKRCGITGGRDMGDCEIAWVRGSSGKAARVIRHFWDGFNRESERGIPRVHPTQKPEVVMAWCLSFVDENYSILDPYMGAGQYIGRC